MEHFMQDIAILAITYGSYISLIKLIPFLVLVFAWLPIVGWVYADAHEVDTSPTLWTGAILAAGTFSILIWLLMPMFLIGLCVYIIAVTTTALVYVKHRNARVMDYDRVLTPDHIKSFFARGDDKLDEMKSFTFLTANGNSVPLPEPRTPDFYGYKQCFELLADAVWRRADSITFAPAANSYSVTYSIDGAPVKQPEIMKDQMDVVLPFIKKLADLDEKEKRKPQRGKFRLQKGKDTYEWDVTTAGSTAGEQARIVRLIEGDITKLTDIGLMPDQFEQLSSMGKLTEGLFIVSGPKRTGVTTTFYAMIRNHDAFMNSINTLEKKSSGVVPNVTQTIYSQAKSGLTFSEELARVIRMGPDIVGVADCDDPEAAKAACTGAIDQKVVYITLEADSVIVALRRWMKLVGDRKLLAHSLLGICNQRMLRKLCDECKQAYAPNTDLFRKFNINAEKTKVLYRAGKVVYDKHGKPSTCENCQGSGFVGRTGIFEIVLMNDDLRKVVRKAKTMQEISTQFRRAKMLYLQEQALRKVINGTTSINEMIRVLSPPKKKGPAPAK